MYTHNDGSINNNVNFFTFVNATTNINFLCKSLKYIFHE